MNTTTPWSTLGGEDFKQFLLDFPHFRTPNTKRWTFNNNYYNWDGKLLTSRASQTQQFYTVDALRRLVNPPEHWKIRGSGTFADFLNNHPQVNASGFVGRNSSITYHYDGQRLSSIPRVDVSYEEITIQELMQLYQTMEEKVTQYKIIKQWPGSPAVGTFLPVDTNKYAHQGVQVRLTLDDKTTISFKVEDWSEYLAPVFPPKAPNIIGYTLVVVHEPNSDVPFMSSVTTGKLGCAEFSIDALSDVYNGFCNLFPSSNLTDRVSFKLGDGSIKSVSFVQIKEILDYATEYVKFVSA